MSGSDGHVRSLHLSLRLLSNGELQWQVVNGSIRWACVFLCFIANLTLSREVVYQNWRLDADLIFPCSFLCGLKSRRGAICKGSVMCAFMLCAWKGEISEVSEAFPARAGRFRGFRDFRCSVASSICSSNKTLSIFPCHVFKVEGCSCSWETMIMFWGI